LIIQHLTRGNCWNDSDKAVRVSVYGAKYDAYKQTVVAYIAGQFLSNATSAIGFRKSTKTRIRDLLYITTEKGGGMSQDKCAVVYAQGFPNANEYKLEI
jgi:hypothetical protein